MSINHCAEVDAYNYEEVSLAQVIPAISAISPSPVLNPPSDSQCGSDFLCTHKKIISLKVKKLFCSSKLFMVYYIHHTTYFKGEES